MEELRSVKNGNEAKTKVELKMLQGGDGDVMCNSRFSRDGQIDSASELLSQYSRQSRAEQQINCTDSFVILCFAF
jgi:hypothetical protein